MNPTELMELPIFHPFELSELDILAGVLHVETCEPKTILFRKGQAAQNCAFVLDGDINVMLPVSGQSQQVIMTMSRGELIGEIAVLDGGRRSANCVVGNNGCRLAMLDKSDFDLIFNASTPLGCKLLRLISRRLVSRLREATAFLITTVGGKTPNVQTVDATS